MKPTRRRDLHIMTSDDDINQVLVALVRARDNWRRLAHVELALFLALVTGVVAGAVWFLGWHP